MKGPRTTLVITTVIVAYLPTTACQCMEFLSNTCSGWTSQTRQPFVRCIDMCLAQTRGNCFYIEWYRRSENCYMGRQPYRANSGEGKDCITMKKETCMSMPEPACLQSTGGNMFQGGEEVKGLSEAKECRSVCVISPKCLAYTWLRKTDTCKLHLGELKRSTERLNDGDEQSQKPNTKRKETWITFATAGDICINNALQFYHMSTRQKDVHGRCLIFRAGMNSGNGRKVNKSLQQCIQSVLAGQYVKVDWDFWSNSCWSHSFNDKVQMRGDKSNLQVQGMRDCAVEEKSVHKRMRRGTGMNGGYQIFRANEAACVELCSRTVNCAAVHFSQSRQTCFFHHEEKATVSNPDFTLYTFDECAFKPTTEMPTTSPTTATTTTTPIIEATSGTLQWSYYKKQDENMKGGFARPEVCMECAFLCLRLNCTSFTCESLNSKDMCNINIISKNSYIPFP